MSSAWTTLARRLPVWPAAMAVDASSPKVGKQPRGRYAVCTRTLWRITLQTADKEGNRASAARSWPRGARRCRDRYSGDLARAGVEREPHLHVPEQPLLVTAN